MAAIFESRTLSVSIHCDPRKVYQYVVDPANLPQWATSLCTAARPSEPSWIIETPQGPMSIRFVEPNLLGVLDHYVTPAPGHEVYVPMRVVANGEGCDVMFTLFRSAQVSDEGFAQDIGMVERDLNTLKEIMEGQ